MSAVNHPSHYGGDTTYEAIKVLKAWGLEKDAYLWNVGKYLARAGKKDDLLQDLEKMAFYLNERIEEIKADREEDAVIPTMTGGLDRSAQVVVLEDPNRLRVGDEVVHKDDPSFVGSVRAILDYSDEPIQVMWHTADLDIYSYRESELILRRRA